ncbi:MAG: putative glutamine amidotransferase [Thermoleophilaceae bacterium]|nr:putative glutamine amidotransferase [Thermoleophilaceae bacterium]
MGAEVRKRPLIGVTTSEVRTPDHVQPAFQSEPQRREMALGMKYLIAIESAGGLPVVMPPLPLEDVDQLLDRLCGIVLSGGPDIDPGTYGGRYHPELGPTEPELDQFELALIHGAEARDMPVLAICRGAQMLNVAHGGTLYQHLPESPGGDIRHRQGKAGDPGAAHDVKIVPNSRLARVIGSETAHVNSFHHQAAEQLGRGLVATAWSADGVVEGIEAPGRTFVVGVQWHAEGLVERPEQAALFEAFVQAASGFGQPAGRIRSVA